MPSVEVLIETPRFGFVKRNARGAVEFVSLLPCPFNYGSIPGTCAEDGDPVDAVVLGRRQRRGRRIRAEVVAEVEFLDGGARDTKLVVSQRGLTDRDIRELTLFFWIYARLKAPWNRVRGRGRTAFQGVRAVRSGARATPTRGRGPAKGEPTRGSDNDRRGGHPCRLPPDQRGGPW